jgi:hypothetical protein
LNILFGYIENSQKINFNFDLLGGIKYNQIHHYLIGGIKYSQIHHYLIDWFKKIHHFLNMFVIHLTPFRAHLCKKSFWKSDWFLMVDFLYLIPPNWIFLTNPPFFKHVVYSYPPHWGTIRGYQM